MVITHHGGQCFKVSFGDTTVLFDPPAKASKRLEPVRFGADIVLSSLHHPDMDGGAEVGRAGQEPFVIDGPGEYDRSGVSVRGFATKSTYDGKDRLGTMYFVELEGMTLCFLGALSETTLPQEAREALDEVDILFVPIGGEGVLEPSDAQKIAVMLEPHVVIPMHYEGIGRKGVLGEFQKEAEAKGAAEEKLTLKKKDVTALSGAIMALKKV